MKNSKVATTPVTRVQRVFSEVRREVQVGEKERLNTLHVYGLDLLKTSDLRAYFQAPDTQITIEWLNDSACNIQYPSDEDALAAVRRLKRGAPSEDGWYQGESIFRKGMSVELSFRFATEMDTKEVLKTKTSQFLCRASKKRAKTALLGVDSAKTQAPSPSSHHRIQKKRNQKKTVEKRKRARLNRRINAVANSLDDLLELKGESSEVMEST